VFGSRWAIPELFGPFDPTVDVFDIRLNHRRGHGKSGPSIGGVVHPLLVVFQVGDDALNNGSGILIEQCHTRWYGTSSLPRAELTKGIPRFVPANSA
jgi:hypothetical protein